MRTVAVCEYIIKDCFRDKYWFTFLSVANNIVETQGQVCGLFTEFSAQVVDWGSCHGDESVDMETKQLLW